MAVDENVKDDLDENVKAAAMLTAVFDIGDIIRF